MKFTLKLDVYVKLGLVINRLSIIYPIPSLLLLPFIHYKSRLLHFYTFEKESRFFANGPLYFLQYIKLILV